MNLKYKLSTILVLIVLMIVLSLSFFKLTPQLLQVFNLKQKLEDQQMSLQNLEQEVESKKSLVRDKLAADVSEEKILRAIPYQMQTDQFLTELKELVAHANLKLNKYLAEDIIEQKGYLKLPILLEVEGEYRAINLFFEELESLSRLVTIEEVNISKQNNKLQSRLLLSIYALSSKGDKR
ncbi:MAG: type 4a pilus biogenesis protein PilO [Halanaerobacter sp.]